MLSASRLFRWLSRRSVSSRDAGSLFRNVLRRVWHIPSLHPWPLAAAHKSAPINKKPTGQFSLAVGLKDDLLGFRLLARPPHGASG